MVLTRLLSAARHRSLLLARADYSRRGQCPPVSKPRVGDGPVILLPVARPNAGEPPTCAGGARAPRALR